MICATASLTRAEGDVMVKKELLTMPGNYPAYYAAIRERDCR